MNATPKEEVMFADHRIDLAHRRGDGIDVVLWWSPEDDSVAVEVLHLASDSSFELSVDRSKQHRDREIERSGEDRGSLSM